MSSEALAQFRTELGSGPDLQLQATQALTRGVDGIAALGAQRGFHFSALDAQAAADNSELSDFELEMVAGSGGSVRTHA